MQVMTSFPHPSALLFQILGVMVSELANRYEG
jgi:hypothetical protein